MVFAAGATCVFQPTERIYLPLESAKWPADMIAALAEGSATFAEADYLQAQSDIRTRTSLCPRSHCEAPWTAIRLASITQCEM